MFYFLFKILLEQWIPIATVIVLLFGVLVTLWVSRHEARKARAQKRWVRQGLHLCKVSDLHPGEGVFQYDANGVTAYLPIPQDSEIENALKTDDRILVMGRPHIGKTHAIVHHLKQLFPDWHLVRPETFVFDHVSSVNLPKRMNYIIFFDDLHKLLETVDVSDIESFVEIVRRHAGAAKVVATMRWSTDDPSAAHKGSVLADRFKLIELADWPTKAGMQLAKLTGVGMASWDGTPLSAKAAGCDQSMFLWYRNATYSERAILDAMKLLWALGLSPCSRKLLEDICCSSAFKLRETDFGPSLLNVENAGFFRQSAPSFEVWDAYLENIVDRSAEQDTVDAVVALLETTKRADELSAIARALLASGKDAKALTLFRKAVELDSTSAKCHYRLGLALAKSKKTFGEAAMQLEEATKISPRWISPWQKLHQVYRKLGRADEADRIVARLSKATRPGVNELIRQAQLLMLSGKQEEALTKLDDLLADDGGNESAYYYRARILTNLRRFPQAAESYLKALSLNPKNVEALCGLARPLGEMGDKVGQKRALEEALKLDDTHPEAHSHLARILLLEGHYAEARDHMARAVELRPDSPEYYSFLGQTYSKLRKVHEEARSYVKAIRLKPNYPEAYSGLGQALRWDRKIRWAIGANKKAIDFGERSGGAYLGLGYCHWDLNEQAAAQSALREAIKLNPNLGAARFLMGKVLIELKDFVAAKIELQEAQRLGFSSGKVEFELNKICNRA